jgi:DNA-binding NarL/FixJ family response regulator
MPEEGSPTDRIRILIADDQAHVRKGLQAVLELEDDLEIVGTATNGLEAVELAERLHPDVILMDLSMPHLDGFEAARRIRAKRMPIPIVAMNTLRDAVSQRQAKQAGIVALIDKATPDTSLCQTIRSAYRSGVPGR